MRMKPILIGLILLIYCAPLVLGGTGEENLKVLDKDGNVIKDYSNISNSAKVSDNDDDDSNSKSSSSSGDDNKKDEGSFFDIDTGDYGITDLLFNPSANIEVFNQITPLKWASIIFSSVVMTLVTIIVILGFFIALGKIGIGALHWDAKKGWKMIEHNKAAAFVLFLAVLGTFVATSITIFMYEYGYKMLGGL